MFLINNDFFDSFDVAFDKKESQVGNKTFPLGYFANEILEFDRGVLRGISNEVIYFKKEMTIFLNTRDVTSAGICQKHLNNIWSNLEKLPLYNLLPKSYYKVSDLMEFMINNPKKVDEMTTHGTELNKAYIDWIYNLDNFSKSINNFCSKTIFMIDEYFENLSSRKPTSYAEAYYKYQRDIKNGYDIVYQEGENTKDLDEFNLYFPMSTTFQAKINPQNNTPYLAEVISFRTLESFLYIDLLKGISIGNIPRLCQNCKKYFLAIGGYDTIYCTRIAPNETEKTCRTVGAHKKERIKNGSTFIQQEYMKVYNRLKSRKQRGSISVDEWNNQVVKIQDLKEQIQKGEISDVVYLEKLKLI